MHFSYILNLAFQLTLKHSQFHFNLISYKSLRCDLITKSIHMKRKVNLDVRGQLWYKKHGFDLRK